MKESSDTPGGEITRIVARIQDLKVDKIADDLDARLELLRLSRKLTAVLEGPVDRATDLVFKVSHIAWLFKVLTSPYSHTCPLLPGWQLISVSSNISLQNMVP
jgi:hypothetical protein